MTRTVLRHARRHLLLAIVSLVFGVPYLWALSTSLKPESQLFSFPPQLVPRPLTFQNYAVLIQGFHFEHFLINSIVITSLYVLGALTSCSMVAYAFARLRWPGRNVMFLVTICTMMLPYQVTMVPLYMIFRNLGWVDTWFPLWVPAWFGIPFYIFLLRQFFLTIPREIEEAAMIDGAGHFRTFVYVVLPLMRPALITVAIFAFINSWNDFIGPVIYVHSPDLMPVSLGLQYIHTSGAYVGQQLYGVLMAGSVLAMAPLIFIYLFLQKYFVRGIAVTGITR